MVYYDEEYRANSTKGEVQRKPSTDVQESLPVESPSTQFLQQQIVTMPAKCCQSGKPD